ncbi:MAG: hypothetical protein JJ884_04030 [Maricaulis sp.]|uniref:hypothetical protein n=1 Tax=Maricaulis sp. TaxID=1486257 RepID=UPI001B188B4A|nr:hypothetical protein [Maricaulis sp.]MBO6729574.1 hypothetical protein [Maricaulis sp.]MBO6846665.1 hypothetical protein [Maricaulis sp.]MBO6877751.1 hypothetical protein [Maricaulis sp.]
MPREIDDKKTRKALRRLARAKRAATESDGDDTRLSEWEDEFLGSLEERLEKFGSAFNDPDKGNLEDALSGRQSVKLREIEKKAKGKGRKPMSRGSGFKRKTPTYSSRNREINDDLPDEVVATPSETASPGTAPKPVAGFKPIVIDGGKLKD